MLPGSPFTSETTYLLACVICAFGAAYIVGHSKISLGLRQRLHDTRFRPFMWLVELLECPACFGFWVGVAWGYHLQTEWSLEAIFNMLVVGAFFAGSNAVLGFWTGLMTRYGR